MAEVQTAPSVDALAESKKAEVKVQDTKTSVTDSKPTAKDTVPATMEAESATDGAKPTTNGAEPSTISTNGTETATGATDTKADDTAKADDEAKANDEAKADDTAKDSETTKSPPVKAEPGRDASSKPAHPRASGRGGHGGPPSRRKIGSKFAVEDLEPTDDPAQIRKQVEFYFSDANLAQDRFLYNQVGGAANKAVPIATLHGFKRMRRFQPRSAVVAALRESATLDVVNDGADVRRKVPLEVAGAEAGAGIEAVRKVVEDAAMARSVYVKGFGPERATTQFELEAWFARHGATNQVRLRRYALDRTFKGSVFVEFDSEATARAFLAREPKPLFQGRDLVIKSKKEYCDEKVDLINDGKLERNQDRPEYQERERRHDHRGGQSGRARHERARNDRRDFERRGGERGAEGERDWRERRDEDRAKDRREGERGADRRDKDKRDERDHRRSGGRGGRLKGRGERYRDFQNREAAAKAKSEPSSASPNGSAEGDVAKADNTKADTAKADTAKADASPSTAGKKRSREADDDGAELESPSAKKVHSEAASGGDDKADVPSATSGEKKTGDDVKDKNDAALEPAAAAAKVSTDVAEKQDSGVEAKVDNVKAKVDKVEAKSPKTSKKRGREDEDEDEPLESPASKKAHTKAVSASSDKRETAAAEDAS